MKTRILPAIILSITLLPAATLAEQDDAARAFLNFAARHDDSDLGYNKRYINDTNDDGQTALMLAVQEERYNRVVIRLISNGANINASDNSGKTALMYAADSNNDDIIRLLLEKGANVNAADNNGKTALMFAADNWNGDSVVRLLIRGGARVNEVDKCGRTAAMFARIDENKSVLEILRNAGADIFSWHLLTKGVGCVSEHLMSQ